MSNHSQLAPSSRSRWGKCPGSVKLQVYGDAPPNEYAIDGTRTHMILEYCLDNVIANASSLVGTTFTSEGEFTVDQDRADRVQVALDYIHNALPGGYLDGFSVQFGSEQKVDLSYITGGFDLRGTCDVVIRDGQLLLHIIDYKDGMNQVFAENNPQMEMYALGVLSKIIQEEGYSSLPHQVKMTIIQPKLALKGLPAIDEWDIRTMDLLAIVLPQLIREATLTQVENASLVPGETQCRYCTAKTTCPALNQKIMDELGFAKSMDIVESGAEKDPSTMNNQKLSEFMQAIPLVNVFVKAVEEEITTRLTAGEDIPGFKLIHGNGSRSWLEDEEKTAKKLIKMGIPKSDVYRKVLVTPAQAEKLRWTKKDGTSHSLSKVQIKRMNDDYIHKSIGNLKIAYASDPKPSAIVKADHMFEPVIELPDWLK